MFGIIGLAAGGLRRERFAESRAPNHSRRVHVLLRLQRVWMNVAEDSPGNNLNILKNSYGLGHVVERERRVTEYGFCVISAKVARQFRVRSKRTRREWDLFAREVPRAAVDFLSIFLPFVLVGKRVSGDIYMHTYKISTEPTK